MRATMVSMANRFSKVAKRPPPPGQPSRPSTASYHAQSSGQATVTFKVKVTDMEPNERLYMVGGTVSSHPAIAFIDGDESSICR